MKKYQQHAYESPNSHIQLISYQDQRSQPKDDKDKMLSFNKSESLCQIPYNILTPSPMIRTPVALSFIGDKNNRFEPWHLSELCNNSNVNRQMENLISQKINFQHEEDDDDQEASVNYTNPDQIVANKIGKDNAFINHHKYRKVQSAYAFYSVEKKCRPKNKGLRKLSEKSYQIVKNIGSTTYKQVAVKLIEELSLEKQPLKDEKEQQNIKRRVYDALNVLIALGILRKEGRKIICNEKFSFAKKDQRKSLQIKKHKLSVSLNQKKKILHNKTQQWKQLLEKVDKSSLLIQRNKKQKIENKIIFPLLGISGQMNQTQKMQIHEERVELKGLTNFSLYKQEEMIHYLSI